jgi:alcohol dehydrogenase YqhD (iron-dependent ADH family)
MIHIIIELINIIIVPMIETDTKMTEIILKNNAVLLLAVPAAGVVNYTRAVDTAVEFCASQQNFVKQETFLYGVL